MDEVEEVFPTLKFDPQLVVTTPFISFFLVFTVGSQTEGTNITPRGRYNEVAIIM